MGLSEIIESMQAAKVPAEQILATIIEIEKKSNIKSLERKEKDRDRKRVQRVPRNPLDNLESTEKKKVSFPSPHSPLDGFPHPSLIPPYTPQTLTSKKKDYPDDFEVFWKLYPPNAASKRKTFEIWKKIINKTENQGHAIRTIATISRGAEAYRAYLERTDTPVAHATTWLNQSRWEVGYAELGGTIGLNGSGAKTNLGKAQGRGSGQTKAEQLDEITTRVLAKYGVETEAADPAGGQRKPVAIQSNAQAMLPDNGIVRQGSKPV